MERPALFPLLASLFFLLPSSALARNIGRADEKVEGDLQVFVDTQWVDELVCGYYPVRVRAVSLAPGEREVVWTLNGRPLTEGRIRTVLRQGVPTEFVLHVPVGPDTTGAYGLAIEPSVGDAWQIPLNLHCAPPWERIAYGGHGGATGFRTALLVSERPLPHPEPPSTQGEVILLTGDLPAQRLPGTWKSYSGLDLIVLPWEQSGLVPHAARSALRDWVAAGGTLLICGGAPPRDDVYAFLQVPVRDRPEHTLQEGGIGWVRGRIEFAPVDSEAWLSTALGRPDAIVKIGAAALGFAFGTQDAGLAIQYRYYGRCPNRRPLDLPIPGVGKPPIGGLLAGATLFAVLIGPVQYFLLRRRKSLHLFWVTTPAGSAAATLLILGYGYASEGFGVKGRQMTQITIDSAAHTQVTVSHIALYAGLVPSGGLRFDGTTAVQILGFGRDLSLSTDETEGLVLRDGWLPAREPTEFRTVRVTPTRARLTLVRDGADWAVENGLGVDLLNLVVKPPEGEQVLVATGKVPDGARVHLQPVVPHDPRGTLSAQEENPKVQTLFQALHARLPTTRGTFQALAESAPESPFGLPDVEEEESIILIGGTVSLPE